MVYKLQLLVVMLYKTINVCFSFSLLIKQITLKCWPKGPLKVAKWSSSLRTFEPKIFQFLKHNILSILYRIKKLYAPLNELERWSFNMKLPGNFPFLSTATIKKTKFG